MVRRLKGPAHGPAFRIQRNYRTRIAIVQCGSMTAIIVRCSISRRYEDEASILVRAHRCPTVGAAGRITLSLGRSEEHTSELQSLMRISYAVFCLKKKNNTKPYINTS